MVVGEPNINNIMGGIENTGSVRLHNHKKKLKQRFDIIKKLGQGTYGKVQLGINKETGQEVAIKTIKKSKIETEADLVRIRREIQIMSSVQHPNIIHIYEVFENREKMVLVMEYAAGGELYDYLSERKVLAEEEARRIFRQISTACYYCHKHKICHRDLKLENILLDENGNAKIADFGLSNVFDERRLLQTFCGSPLYASPEIVKGTPYHGPEVDCWSLGVLLYTLVYGAMPFDGSNFKRLVKQISQGDYFEPKKPSRASQLIKDMLTVNPARRADIEKICAHWWVNEGYDDSCLEISEDLANQTPVRLDLLLSLAPPPPQLESDKLVFTGEIADEASAEAAGLTKSQSAGSIMEMAGPARRRIDDLIADEMKPSKRKLETTISTDQANLSKEGVRRKEKIIKDNTIADITTQPPIEENQDYEVEEIAEKPINRSETRIISRAMDIEKSEELSNQGAACVEIMEDARIAQNNKLKETEGASQDTNQIVNKENVIKEKKEKEEKPKTESKIPAKRKVIKKKVLTDKNENTSKTNEVPKTETKKIEKKPETKDETKTNDEPAKPVERRRSRIFETAEKFQNMILANEQKEKPKKVKIPGVSVGGFKKEFERKASLTSGSILLPKGSMTVKPGVSEYQKPEIEKPAQKDLKVEEKETPVIPEENSIEEKNEERRTQVKNAVDIIFNALNKDGARKSKSRPCIRKPPVPFGVSGRSASGSIGPLMSPPPIDKFRQPPLRENQIIHGSTPAQVVEEPSQLQEENKTSSAEFTLKSATLPRRKTTKAEIKLDYNPTQQVAPMGFKTEMAHHVQAPPKLPTQRSEASFPVSSPLSPPGHRSASVEPETKKERIIPISFERDDKPVTVASKAPPIRNLQNQKSTTSQDSNLSRQSTQDSDSETLSTGEPIRKSPREYIIPIAVEGGGYVTPRAGSLEPSESASTTNTVKSRFRRKFLDREGSEEDAPFGTLHRHSSIGKDSDTEDPKRDMFRMHSLRSSRPRKPMMEHNDSFSSGEDDDDDGFEILTAENLFSTLLSRVRDLTQRMNVDGRPSFQNSRLLSGHFDHGSNFWNLHNRVDPLARRSPLGRSFNRGQDSESSSSAHQFGSPWRRSVSRDLATDIDTVFNNSSIPTQSTTLPRGDETENKDNLNLSDLDLKKLRLSDEDALALSYLTPGLSRRIQKQLLAQLAPAAARKLSRTLSMRNSSERKSDPVRMSRRSADPSSCTLPRRYSSVDASPSRFTRNVKSFDATDEEDEAISRRSDSRLSKTIMPINSPFRESDSPYNERTESSLDFKPNTTSLSSEKPNYVLAKSDSSTSESLSSYKTDDQSFLKSSSSLISKPIIKPTNSTYGPFSSEASRLSKYLDPAPKYEPTRPYSPPHEVEKRDARADIRTSPKPRRSRFLRPSFYESNTKNEPVKDEHYFIRDKKEREMEAQQILQEIRDKRERKESRSNLLSDERTPTYNDERKQSCLKDFTKLFKDEVKSKSTNSDTESTEKLLKNVSENIKKLESSVQSFHDYVNVPAESKIHDYVNVNEETKIPNYVNVPNCDELQKVKKERTSRIARPKSYPAEGYDSNGSSPKPETKSRISRLKQPEKISKTDNDKPTKNKFLHSIEKKLEKLRSFSNSPTSGSDDSKSRDERKSSVENTIKRLREQSLPKNIKSCPTESGLIKRAVSVEDLTNEDIPEPKPIQTSKKSVTKILNLFKKYEDKGTKGKSEEPQTKTEIGANSDDESDNSLRPLNQSETVEPKERPKSLMFDGTKPFTACNTAKSEGNITNEKEVKMRSSKLPVTTFRRSLNMEPEPKKDRQLLKLDLNASTSKSDSRKSGDDTFLSPTEDSADSWSICSEHHPYEVTSPISPGGHFLSADENDSVSDRIRRKSFYMRFNDNKRPRKGHKGNYKDLDLYKESQRKSGTRTTHEYGSLGRQSVDRVQKERQNARASSNLDVDDVSGPIRYPTYSPRVGRRSSRDFEERSLDDNSGAEKNRLNSYHSQPYKTISKPTNGQPLCTGQSS